MTATVLELGKLLTRFSNHCLKNRQGGLARKRESPIDSKPEAGGQCHVHIFYAYISKLPEEVKSLDFFMPDQLQNYRLIHMSPGF